MEAPSHNPKPSLATSRPVPETHGVERDPTVDELLRRWQVLRERGDSPTIGDLCADCPEKAAELKERLQAVASMMSLLGLEPESGSTGSLPTEDRGLAGSSPTIAGESPGPGADAADPSNA